MGVAVNGMHYTGMAALRVYPTPGATVSTAGTVSALAFLLPLIIGLSTIGFIFSTVIALSPTAAEIVEEGELVQTAIGIVHRWTPPGGATAAHLALLRPPLDEIEQAMAAETAATRATEADELSRAGISRFLGRPRPATT